MATQVLCCCWDGTRACAHICWQNSGSAGCIYMSWIDTLGALQAFSHAATFITNIFQKEYLFCLLPILNAVPAFKTRGTFVWRGRPAFWVHTDGSSSAVKNSWVAMATIAARSPGRDAELQQAFVVIKTECQAEEGWQWIKASLCVSQHVHVFQGERRFLCASTSLPSFKFV